MSVPMAAVSRPLAGRAVHIKVQPKTRSIRESREILRVLKNFGDVTSYQNLQYDAINPAPHTILAIFDSPRDVSDLIAAAPLSVTIPPPPLPRPVASPASHGLLDFIQDKASLDRGRRFDSKTRGGRELMLHVDYSTMNHQSAVQHKPHYWSYPCIPRTFAEQTLLREVPDPGLAIVGGVENSLVNRIVKKNLLQVAARKPVRQILEERDRLM